MAHLNKDLTIKQAEYIVNKLSSGGGGGSVDPYTSNPEMDGTASPGTSDKYARGDHVHPHDTNVNAYRTAAIPYGEVDNTSTATAFTATVTGITAYYDGVTMLLKNGVITSAAGFTIDINSLGAKPVYTNMEAATAETTKFNVNYTMLFVYDSDRVEGGCWICYNGYDSNTNTIGYQLRTNSALRPAADKGYKYRIWFTSVDGLTWVPANLSSSTSATASKTPNTRAIDPFGEIIYCSTNGTTNAGDNLSATACWEQYILALGYSYNTTGAALTLINPAPVYLKCIPQTAGGVKVDGYVQALPNSADGKVYLFLGMAYSATNIELFTVHPVYYHDGTGIRLWTGKAIPTKTSELSNDSGFITDAGVTSFNGNTGAVTYTAPVTSVNGSTGAVTITVPTIVSTTVTLTTSGWSTNTQTASVSGVTDSNSVIVSYAIASKADYTSADIYCSAQSTNSLTFTCATTPTNNVTVNVLILS